VNTLVEFKALIAAAIAKVAKDLLQRFWKYVDCRIDVCRKADTVCREVFRT
jgi:hypothetical protein